ncbi:MAG: hypothetical protein AUI00_02950 [Verrucomicrobia bacterium 13_2_20CM_2_54_15]|nr:MAG: hypothetical protein AUI00_02950 [Verrucomicrobia bacterium 13_2_20CM_2_54_15]
MYPLNQLKTLVSCGRDPARSLPFRRGFLLIPLMLGCFALSPQIQAALSPPPDGDYPGGTTAEGHDVLNSLTSGIYNSGFGIFSLLLNTTGDFNTGLGAGTLLLNSTASEGTAVGAGALLSNTTGANNTGYGTFALFTNSTGEFNNAVGANSLLFNTDGDSNNALGESALFNNQIGSANTAIGDVALSTNDNDGAGLGNANTAVGAGALFSNTDGDSNNAVGFNALGSNADGLQNNVLGFDAMADNISGSGNVAVGDSAGAGVEGSFNIYIGWGVTPGANEDNTIRIGDPLDVACFVGGIFGATATGGLPVVVNADGKLGTVPADSPISMSQVLKQRQIVQELKATTERQAAVIALQEGQIKALTAGLKQQADQIQQVSAQLEMIRPTPRVVENR